VSESPVHRIQEIVEGPRTLARWGSHQQTCCPKTTLLKHHMQGTLQHLPYSATCFLTFLLEGFNLIFVSWPLGLRILLNVPRIRKKSQIIASVSSQNSGTTYHLPQKHLLWYRFGDWWSIYSPHKDSQPSWFVTSSTLKCFLYLAPSTPYSSDFSSMTPLLLNLLCWLNLTSS
jgi:hypothetical protein